MTTEGSPAAQGLNGGATPEMIAPVGRFNQIDRTPSDPVQDALAMGWAVFPVHGVERNVGGFRCTCRKEDCGSPGKHPRTFNGVKDASSDPAVVAEWRKTWPDTNWGVACGAVSGIVVIDVDVRKNGRETMDAYEANRPDGPLPATRRHLSGGEGRHLIFAYPDDGEPVRNRNNWLPGVDVKADGGYVVLPGSVHVSGGSYSVADHRPPEPLPVDLLADIRGAGSGQSRAPLGSDAYILSGVPEGQRDDVLFRACCRWWRQFTHHEDGGLAEVTARVLEAARACTPPFPEAEARAKVESALRYVTDDERLRLSDDGNALLYVEQHGGVVRYASDTERWHTWDGTRWEPNARTRALDLARLTARSLMDVALEVPDQDARIRAMRHAMSSLSRGRIEAMHQLARSDQRIAIKTGQFDTDPWLLNTPTGTLDLRSGTMREHRRGDYMTKLTGVGYDPAAEAPYWRWWVRHMMLDRDDLAEFLQRAIGYALTGDTREQVFFLLHGTGANGKTTFLNVLEAVLGDYAWHAEPELLTPKDGGHPTGQADLHGRRFVVASETREGRRLDERTVKQLTGQDTVTARKLYQDFFTFRPTHKIFFATNHRPVITDDSHAMWRRVLLIPWERRIEPRDQVRDLVERIVAAEGAGVLRWAVEGCLKWRENGLLVPADVRASTDRYRANEDSLGSFIEDALVVEDGSVVGTNSVLRAYEQWCVRQSLHERNRVGRNQLLGRLEDRLGVPRVRRRVNGANINVFVGVRLHEEWTWVG